jgi:SAM-dependent methyltransferase
VVDPAAHNREFWDRQVEKGNAWTRPVGPEVIAAARRGDWHIVLTPTKPVPRNWFPPLEGRRVLCLASGGGQQGPVLAAAGAEVTVFDNSPKQLGQDRFVAEREGLPLRLELGDMRDLSRFSDGSFDLVVLPGSVCFIDAVRPLWRETYRILADRGVLLAAFPNPIQYIFDLKAWDAGELVVRHRIPYSELTSLPAEELQELIIGPHREMCFGHSLHDLIQGQLEVGFVITGFYEDNEGGGPLDPFIDSICVTRAVKLSASESCAVNWLSG